MPTKTNNKLAHFYFLSGDEALLIQEARDQICQAAREQGFSDRQLVTIETTADWQSLLHLTQNRGLFSEKQLIDVRYASAKFDKALHELLIEYARSPNPDVIILLSCAKLTSAQKKAQWFKSLEPHIRAHFIWPLKLHELPTWIQTRLKRYTLKADHDAIKLLIELTEGNLLATNQAIQKLAILYRNQLITPLEVTQVVHDSTQFNVFELARYALAGHTERCLHAIDSIRAAGGEPILVLWALSKEARELYTLVYHYHHGMSVQPLLAKQWATRKPLLEQAIKRLSQSSLHKIITLSHQTDLMIKGVQPGDPWQNLKTIAVILTGAST